MDSPHRLAPLQRLIRRHRRPVAAILAALAVLASLAALRPEGAVTTGVVLVTRDLPAGVTLGAGDISVGDVPAAATVPGSLTRPEDALGRVTVGPLLAGEPVTHARLLDPRAAPGTGRVTVPVRLSDPGVAELMSPGDVIDLVAVGSGPAAADRSIGEVVARGARVVTVPREPATGFPQGGYEAGALILVSVPASVAPRLASLSGQRRLSPILRAP